jgi:hypothetical protein
MSGKKGKKAAPTGAVGRPNGPPDPTDQKRDHVNNSKNGNALASLAGTAHTQRLAGRSAPNLPIYEIDFTTFKDKHGGEFLLSIVQTILADDDADSDASWANRRTNHDDNLGNLPAATGGATFREYHVQSNKLPKPAYMRLVADVANRRLYVTPTHYEVWLNVPPPDKSFDYKLIANSYPGAKNPFFLLRAVSGANAIFD